MIFHYRVAPFMLFSCYKRLHEYVLTLNYIHILYRHDISAYDKEIVWKLKISLTLLQMPYDIIYSIIR